MSSTYQSKEGYLAIGTSTAPTIPLDVTGTANMTTLSIGGTAITATPAQLNYVAGVTSAIQTQLNAKEPTISAGTTAQYWRGDKTWQTPAGGGALVCIAYNKACLLADVPLCNSQNKWTYAPCPTGYIVTGGYCPSGIDFSSSETVSMAQNGWGCYYTGYNTSVTSVCCKIQ